MAITTKTVFFLLNYIACTFLDTVFAVLLFYLPMVFNNLGVQQSSFIFRGFEYFENLGN